MMPTVRATAVLIEAGQILLVVQFGLSALPHACYRWRSQPAVAVQKQRE